MYEVVIFDVFSATHQLRLPNGDLEPLHGHDWGVRVTLAGQHLDQSGMLVDFHVAQARLREVLSGLNHRCLNATPPFENANPSAELVARHLAEQLGHDLPSAVRVAAVEVEEAPGCFARFVPPPDGGTR